MTHTAIYGRTSSQRQEAEQTIQSQLADLRTCVQQDGFPDAIAFTDEGYSRSDLVRPNLDRLRTLIRQGDVDRLYVHSPDRLASGGKLLVLLEEFRDNGATIVFIKGGVEDTPEGALSMGVLGVVAEFERTKIAERTRRGKNYWAREGAFLGGIAPYGFRVVPRTDGHRSELAVDEEQSAVVRRMFRMLVDQRMSLRAIAIALTSDGVPTARGARQWQPMAVDRILRNPVVKGSSAFRKTQRAVAKSPRSADPYRKNRKTGHKSRPEEEWIVAAVPAIVDADLWERAQQQLQTNAANSKRNRKHTYLLSGLIRCPRCGGGYTGKARGDYRYYRCGRTDAAVSSTGQRCAPGSMGAERIEHVVWAAIAQALQQPQVLIAEYERRIEVTGSPVDYDAERKTVAVGLKRIATQQDRMTDAYKNEAIDLPGYKAEMDKFRTQRTGFEQELDRIAQREQQAVDSEKAIEQLERFCSTIALGLDDMNDDDRKLLLQLVVERIMVVDGHVTIETIIPMGDDGKLSNPRPEALEGRTHSRRPQPPPTPEHQVPCFLHALPVRPEALEGRTHARGLCHADAHAP